MNFFIIKVLAAQGKAERKVQEIKKPSRLKRDG
jgi:hypothetical protein